MLVVTMLGGRFSNYLTGLSAAMSMGGIDVMTWDPAKKSAIEMHEDLRPQVLFVDSDYAETNKACDTLNRLPCLKVVVGDLLNTNLKYDLFASVNPLPNFQRAYHLRLAANAAQYNRPETAPELECDVAVLGDRLGGLQQHIDYLASLRDGKQGKNLYRVRIHTTEPTYHKEYVGVLSHVERRNLFGAARVILTNDDQTYLDGTFCGADVVCDGRNGLILTTNEVAMLVDATTSKYLSSVTPVLLRQKKVAASETYFHRTVDILSLLNLRCFDPNKIVSGLV